MNVSIIDPSALNAQPVRYSNEFGSLEITPVTPFMPVSGISSKNNPIAQANLFDMITAEKIALITENRRVQVCFEFPLTGKAYLVLHDSPSTAAICKVNLEAFTCKKSPAEMLNDLNRQQCVML